MATFKGSPGKLPGLVKRTHFHSRPGESIGGTIFPRQGPHKPCCRVGQGQAASIVNPYTGREIALGQPYVFQNQAYFSVNLVARALTGWDTMGATLSLLPVFPSAFDAGGTFVACNRGEFALSNQGETFSFTYPRIPLTAIFRNNNFFHAEGNRGGRLELLCHTTRAELDPDICYAYITLETLRVYMLNNGFFNAFLPDLPANAWHFHHVGPLRQIVEPGQNSPFQVGDALAVSAAIQDARTASLILNGRNVETQTGLSGRNVVFGGHVLTEDEAGSLEVSIEARNGFDVPVNIPAVRVNVSEIVPSVRITAPQNGDAFHDCSQRTWPSFV